MIGIAEFNSAIGGVKNHTEITGHNCGFGILIILTPDLAYHSAGGFDLQQANNIGCSHMTIPSAGGFLCSPKRGSAKFRQSTTTAGNPATEQNQADGDSGEYRCSYLSIESQICNSPGNKKGSTANATSLNCIFLKYQLNQSIHYSVNPWWRKVYPLGSMPRDCSSLRRTRLIHVASDVSPSFFISASNCSRNSTGSLIWYCGDLFNSCIDMCNYPSYYQISVITRVITFCGKSNKARKCVNTNRASNHNVNRSNTMAMYKSTQTHPKFKWRFFSCQQSRYFTVEARSEQEARSMLPDAPCLFSARIRQGVNHA